LSSAEFRQTVFPDSSTSKLDFKSVHEGPSSRRFQTGRPARQKGGEDVPKAAIDLFPGNLEGLLLLLFQAIDEGLDMFLVVHDDLLFVFELLVLFLDTAIDRG
jgi:hypothetical protein